MIRESTVRQIYAGEITIVSGTPKAILEKLGHSAIQWFRGDSLSEYGKKVSTTDTSWFVGRMTETMWGDLNEAPDKHPNWRVLSSLVTLAIQHGQVPRQPESAFRILASWYTALVFNSTKNVEGPDISDLNVATTLTERQTALARPRANLIWTVEHSGLPPYEELTPLVGALNLRVFPQGLPIALPVLENREEPSLFTLPAEGAIVQELMHVPRTSIVVAALTAQAGLELDTVPEQYALAA